MLHLLLGQSQMFPTCQLRGYSFGSFYGHCQTIQIGVHSNNGVFNFDVYCIFKYSILEVCNMNLGNEYIISRETHWKEVLLTRTFGLNQN